VSLRGVAWVGVGGALGSIARHLISTFAIARWGTGWPWGTFFINISGCLMIAFFLTLGAEKVQIHESLRYLFPIGFVGAYTTFSTYEWETMRLIQTGGLLRAAGYVIASTVVGLGAVYFAQWLARRL